MHVEGLHLRKMANTLFLPSFVLQSRYGKDRLLFDKQHSRLDLNFSLKHKEDTVVPTVLFYINVKLLQNTVISSKWRFILLRSTYDFCWLVFLYLNLVTVTVYSQCHMLQHEWLHSSFLILESHTLSKGSINCSDKCPVYLQEHVILFHNYRMLQSPSLSSLDDTCVQRNVRACWLFN